MTLVHISEHINDKFTYGELGIIGKFYLPSGLVFLWPLVIGYKREEFETRGLMPP